jgi:hypothetical protein
VSGLSVLDESEYPSHGAQRLSGEGPACSDAVRALMVPGTDGSRASSIACSRYCGTRAIKREMLILVHV